MNSALSVGQKNAPSVFGDMIRALFPGYFALVMATGIVSIAALLEGFKTIAWVLFILNNVYYVILWLLTLARLTGFRSALMSDLTSHAVGPTFLTTVAATCVLGTQYELLGVSTPIALGLLALGAILWAVLIYVFFTSVTIRATKPTLAEGLNGAWLLVVVSTQSIAVLGALLAPQFASQAQAVLFAALCMYLLGCMFYLLIIALIFYRFTFFPLSAKELSPPYWINMGAVAITTLAGVRLLLRTGDWSLLAELRPFLIGFTLFFWATATWWIPMLVILGEWRHVAQRFPIIYHPTYWALVFPLGMYTVATLLLAKALDLGFLLIVPHVSVYVALIAWMLVSLGMAFHIARCFLSRSQARP